MQANTIRAIKALLLPALIGVSLAAPFAVSAQSKIIAVGDSITEGVGGATSYRKPLTDDLNSTGCNYEMVGSRTQNRTGTFVSRHEGYSAQPVQFFLDSVSGTPRIDTMMTTRADVVLIHLGSNDARIDRNPDVSVSDLDDLVTRIWNINADAEIFVANVIPWYGSSTNSNITADVQTLGNRIQTWVANENDSRLHLVDVRSGYSINLMQSDGIHPDANGDAHIADAFLSVMDQVDICPPDTTITSPSSAGQLLSGSYTFTGTATDIGNTGINRVRIAIEDNNHTNDNNRWFNFSTGTFGSFSATVATLTNVTASSTDWNINTVLPRGDYTLYALAIDNADRQNYYNIGLWPTNQQFFVSADNTLPTISIDPIGSQTSGNVNISGDANDNLSLIHI